MTCVRRLVISSSTTYPGGSSSVLSSALAASSFITSTRSSTNTRNEASNGVCAEAATTVSSTSRRSISCAPEGVTHVRSGWVPCWARVFAFSGSRAFLASSSAAKSRAAWRFPLPAGPCRRYAWAGESLSAAPRTAWAWGWAVSWMSLILGGAVDDAVTASGSPRGASRARASRLAVARPCRAGAIDCRDSIRFWAGQAGSARVASEGGPPDTNDRDLLCFDHVRTVRVGASPGCGRKTVVATVFRPAPPQPAGPFVRGRTDQRVGAELSRSHARRPSNSQTMLISVEGLDGAGKTTLVTALARELEARPRSASRAASSSPSASARSSRTQS